MTLVYPDHFWKTGGKALKIARGLLLLLSLFSHEPDTFQPSPVLLIFAVTPDRCSEFLTCLMEKAYLGGIKHNLKNPRSWVAVIRMDHRDTNVPVFPPQSVFHYTSHGGSGLLLYYPHLLQSRSQVPPSQVVRPPCPSTWGSATGSASTKWNACGHDPHRELPLRCKFGLSLLLCCFLKTMLWAFISAGRTRCWGTSNTALFHRTMIHFVYRFVPLTTLSCLKVMTVFCIIVYFLNSVIAQYSLKRVWQVNEEWINAKVSEGKARSMVARTTQVNTWETTLE